MFMPETERKHHSMFPQCFQPAIQSVMAMLHQEKFQHIVDFLVDVFHARISQTWSASCRIQLKHWTTPMIQPCLRDSGMKNINQKIRNVLKLFLVKHFHNTLNGWLKTLRKHEVMFSLVSAMNITHTFSILWPCFHQKTQNINKYFTIIFYKTFTNHTNCQ